MAWRASCGTILRSRPRRSGSALARVHALALAWGLVAAGCRGEPTRTASGNDALTTGHSAGPRTAEATTSPESTPMTSPTVPTPPSADVEPFVLKPMLAAEEVVPTFQRWWSSWSKAQLAGHPLQATLDERVAAGGTVRSEACGWLVAHVRERAPEGSPERLLWDDAAITQDARCWWIHHDGMMGPGLGAVLTSHGRVAAVWVVREG